MDMKEFLKQYAENLLDSLKKHRFGLESFNWTCDLCPLKELCEKDSEENFSGCVTCGQFIKGTVTDGEEYRL
jgi:hypothetical protein